MATTAWFSRLFYIIHLLSETKILIFLVNPNLFYPLPQLGPT